jgi:radical SAM protein with 4Fe4S-binding SPASM domain
MDVGGRMKGWLHINSLGETFICCDDYHMEYKFGDFKTMELKEFWNSEEHRNIMKKAGETLCKKCIHAVFEG